MVLECRDILQLDPPTNAVIGPSPAQRRVATSKNPTTCTQPSDVLSHKLIHHHIGNKKDHCSQTRCQPIVWPCPIARLWISRTWHMVGDCTPPLSRSQPTFQHVCYSARDPATACHFTHHLPAMSTDCPATSDGGLAIPRPVVRGPMATVLPRSRSPYPPPAVL